MSKLLDSSEITRLGCSPKHELIESLMKTYKYFDEHKGELSYESCNCWRGNYSSINSEKIDINLPQIKLDMLTSLIFRLREHR